MRHNRGRRLRLQLAAVPAVVGLLLVSACSSAKDSGGSTGASGPGVSQEPCPRAIDKEKGCLYLGVLSDLEGGPFAVLGRQFNEGQLDFWKKANAAGGIGDYEVDLAQNTRNTAYDPQKHAAAYQQVEPNVLALAMSLGTVNTQAVLDQMDTDNMVAGAGTLWSGWQFPDTDKGLLIETGYSYCTEAVMGLDWFADNHKKPAKIASVVYKGDYGGDYAEGAKRWAKANGVDIAAEIQTGPNAAVGNQDGPVGQIVAAAPDVVVLATGPAETAEIVGKAAQAGYKGRFLGAGPTWNGALLKTPAAPALIALYNATSPIEGWDGSSAGIKAAHDAIGDKQPENWGYVYGFAMSYAMKALLDKANSNNKLNREGLRAAIDGLQVDFDGIAAKQTFGAKPDVKRLASVIIAPDPAAQLGTRTVLKDYKGSTLEKISYDAPCVAS
ncbi:ABC transporter substrate-binding protein [Nocardia altamirensis]|uniref:ABC transporter substrate-binding protein n=1 Tax=Nocardia altamirensis TaxID=472158 RepID=UPI0008401F28|nr:ABC transporter substrate-binding protein [Nocardia altamirensis]